MIFEHIVVGNMYTNCYILADAKTKDALIIDPGAEVGKIRALLDRLNLRARFIINTHGHIDHIGGINDFNIPVYAHKYEKQMFTSATKNLSSFLSQPFEAKVEFRPLIDGDKVSLGEITLKVIHTPGHTRGGICLLLLSPITDVLFSGDTLFSGSIGRTDLEGASEEALLKSISEKILILPDKTVVYPGHGPKTTVGHEKKCNPFFCR